jgi:DNA-binding GntR family transcriptional regulator
MSQLPVEPEAAEPYEAKSSIQRRVYLLLRDMIEDGRIMPGEKLLEAQVAKSFGISRSPARIALAALCAEKRVVEGEGRGYRVAGKPARGPGASGPAGRSATLAKLELTSTPQWERMYTAVERELCTRVLFGSVRITEEALAQQFNVSRTVARDVMARMHSVGALSKDRIGHWRAERVTAERISHLFEMRRLLEPTALVQAAPFISREQLEGVRGKLIGEIERRAPERPEMDTAETDLHINLLARCPNREITHALARTHVLFVPTRYLSDPYLRIPNTLIDDALVEHLQVIDALLAGDVAGAARALAAHLEEADARWMLRFDIVSRMTQPDLPGYLSAIGD